jgi:hypothetical protein
VIVLASGASGVTPSADEVAEALTAACTDLAMQLLSDAEGSTKDIAITVRNAATVDDALTAGRACARNNLLKTALFGNDPNWGRVLAAIGTTDAAVRGRSGRRDRSTASPSAGAGAIGDSREASTSPAGRSHRRRPAGRLASRPRSGPTTCPIAYVHENSAYSTGAPPRTGAARDDAHDTTPRYGTPHPSRDSRSTWCRPRPRIGTHRVMRTDDPEGDARKVAVLTGALPWLKEFHGNVVVIKYGGHAMVDEECRRAFAEDMVFLRTCGHPAGRRARRRPADHRMLGRLGIESEFRGGCG